MAATDLDLAEYSRNQVVSDRNHSTLLRWAGYIATQDFRDPGQVPQDETGKPLPAWVRLRSVAEMVPINTSQYVARTMSFFAQDPAVSERLFEWLGRNSPEVEADLSEANRRIVDGFMPRFAATEIAEGMLQGWYGNNGWPAPPVEPPPGPPPTGTPSEHVPEETPPEPPEPRPPLEDRSC